MNLITALNILEIKNPDTDATDIFRDVVAAYQFLLENWGLVCEHFRILVTVEEVSGAQLVVDNLDDIFEDIFGFTRLGRVLGYQPPQDIILTVAEIALGGEKILKMPAFRVCTDCRGVGAAKGALSRICRHCFGRGYTLKKAQGQSARKTCPRCSGRGRETEKTCPTCDGFGRIRIERKQRLALPVGLKIGGIYTLSAVDIKTDEPTEVFVRVHAEHDRIFQIENYDLLCEYHMDFLRHPVTAVLNFETPFGKKAIAISAAAKPGDVVIVQGAGLFKDNTRKDRGNLKIALRQKKRSLMARIFRRVT